MKFQGWAITYWLSFSILLVVVLFLFIAGWYPSSILVAIRSTGRTSLILFSGVSFAASHFIHLALIGAIALAFPEPFLKDQAPSQWIFGGLGYVFVALMALTSSDRAQQWMGMKKWKKLHLVGGYYIWFVFFITYIKHTKQDPTFYTPFLVFTGAVLVLRIVKHLHVGRIKKS